MTPEKLLQQILSGKKSVPFREFIKLVEAFGFVLDRVRGSHRIYKGEAKWYQIKQFLEIVERYGLSLEGKE